MKPFLHPLPFLILFHSLLVTRTKSSDCPKFCSCQTPITIFCTQRRSTNMPWGLPAFTQNLYLFQNGIKTLTQDDFLGLDRLELLDLSQNKLTNLPDNVFKPLSSLRNLDLSSNHITHISQDSFSGLTLLERLYLFNNQIKNIHPEAFEGLQQLLELKLQGNQLIHLPALHKPSLLLLDISYNHIILPSPTDLQTPNLESLKMAGMGLTSLSEELMANLDNLHDLDISQNHLKAVPSALREARGLIRLNLAGNPVGQLKQEDFQNLEMLQDLDISNLNLQGFPEGFGQLFPKLQYLTVAENPFNCLCPLAWFPGWLHDMGLKLGRTEETRCHFPPVNAGKVLEKLRHRDFGCPTTTTVTTTTVSSSTPRPPLITTQAHTTHALPPPLPTDDPTMEVESDMPLLIPVSPSSSTDLLFPGIQFCPSNICLNGGTCQLDQHGQLECSCPLGTSGRYCENTEDVLPPEFSTVSATAVPDINSRDVTSTTILLDLHRYIKTRPYIRGIRLTYRNLSGPDRRPVHLSVPASYPEYTLRGLRPNSTYSVCASPLGEPGDEDSSCTEARTAEQQHSPPERRVHSSQLTTTLVPTLIAVVLSLVVAAVVGTVCYLRRKRAKCHMDLDCEPSPLEMEGVKSCLDNGALPQKQTELMLSVPAIQGAQEYEVPLMQTHCTANNNVAALKPSYF
ncbi:vasorin b [Scleropages formosus]|uniref:Vasorin b n=1 Tax=Scleropages formosus TaxID=113540 RepID=A0A8C9RI92_SCLFO|nr:vasorin [Scleropages formosus]XP_018598523.2 vasorin [Scleropages formosus]